MEAGAKSVRAMVTHGLLTGDAVTQPEVFFESYASNLGPAPVPTNNGGNVVVKDLDQGLIEVASVTSA